MKRMLSVLLIAIMFSSCVGTNQKDSKKQVETGGDEVTRKDGCRYIVLYDTRGEIATVFHSGACPNPNHKK